MKIYDVIVIGAGPSGLSAAYYLKDSLNYIILESGGVPGYSWKNMPKNISLISPWYVNSLPGTISIGKNIFKQHSCKEFQNYLENYNTKHQLNTMFNARVERVEKNEEEALFKIILNNGNELFSKSVINSTGYFFNPIFPDNFKLYNLTTPHIHVQQFKNAKWVANNYHIEKNKILVVGSRISAGQTAAELYEYGFNVTISARSEISFAQEQIIQKLVYIPYYIYEFFKSKILPNSMENTNPPMEAGKIKIYITSNKIDVKPQIKRQKGKEIEFLDGTKESYDLVIFCTGFSPAVKHIEFRKDQVEFNKNGESKMYKNLYFLGLDKQFTFRSRYLRGIREDARKIVSIIKKSIDNEI